MGKSSPKATIFRDKRAYSARWVELFTSAGTILVEGLLSGTSFSSSDSSLVAGIGVGFSAVGAVHVALEGSAAWVDAGVAAGADAGVAAGADAGVAGGADAGVDAGVGSTAGEGTGLAGSTGLGAEAVGLEDDGKPCLAFSTSSFGSLTPISSFEPKVVINCLAQSSFIAVCKKVNAFTKSEILSSLAGNCDAEGPSLDFFAK